MSTDRRLQTLNAAISDGRIRIVNGFDWISGTDFQHDHAVDALAYALNARPRRLTRRERLGDWWRRFRLRLARWIAPEIA